MPLITRMMAQGVDLFDLNSNSPGDAGLMLKQARQAGYKGLVWQVGGPAVAETMATEGYDAGVIGPVVWGGQAEYGVNHQLLTPFWIAGVQDGKEVMLARITPEKR